MIFVAVVKLTKPWAGALVKCIWEETHVLKVVGSNPAQYTGWKFFTVQNVMFV